MSSAVEHPDHLQSGPAVRHRLFANEPAHGPSPLAIAAARDAVARVGAYPDELASDLRDHLARREGVSASAITVGNGSTAVIAALVEDAVARGGRVVSFAGSFAFYRAMTLRLAGEHVAVGAPASPRDVEALAATATDARDLVIVDDPGSPTGQRLPDGALSWLAHALPPGTTLLVDEAYHEFADPEVRTAAHRELAEHPDLVVTRTFSKALGLPGLRVGYAVCDQGLATRLRAQRDRAQVPMPSLAGAAVALADDAHTRTNVEAAVRGRDRVRAELAHLGVETVASDTNYVLVPTHRAAADVASDLAAGDIGVRDMTSYGLPNAVRVSIGAPASIDAFLEAASAVAGITR